MQSRSTVIEIDGVRHNFSQAPDWTSNRHFLSLDIAAKQLPAIKAIADLDDAAEALVRLGPARAGPFTAQPVS